jgi:hypothetical protein
MLKLMILLALLSGAYYTSATIRDCKALPLDGKAGHVARHECLRSAR